MIAQSTPRLGMALDDYMQRYSDEGRFEIVNGELIIMSPHASEHGLIVRWLFVKLFQFLISSPDWEVFQEFAFAQIEWGTPGTPNWVKGSLEPDIMLVSKAKLTESRAARLDWKRWPISVIPALVIEVVSPTDRYKVIMDKIAAYLNLGVSVVWLIDPDHRTVSVYQAGRAAPEVIEAGQDLPLPDLLAGLNLSLTELFDAQ